MPYALATFCLPGLALLSLWVAPAPYLHDFGEWLFQSRVLVNQWRAPELVAGYLWAPYPVPNSLAVVLLALLGLLFPALTAGKVFLSLLLLAWIPVLRLFLRRCGWHREALQPMLALLWCLLALSPFFWTGFVGYQLGILLLCWFLARFDERMGAAEIAAFGVALFFAHAMPLLVFGLIVLLTWSRTPRRWRLLLGLVPALVLGLWFVGGRLAVDFEAPAADASFAGWGEALTYRLAYPLLLGPFRNLLWPDQTSVLDALPAVYWVGFLVNVFIVAGCGLLVLLALRAGPARPATSQPPTSQPRARAVQGRTLRPALWWALAILVVCYLLAPYNFFGLINPSGRLLIPMLLLAVMLLGAGRRRSGSRRLARWMAPPVVVASLLVLGAYGWMMSQAGPPRDMVARSPDGRAPIGSVLAYHQWVHGQARYPYFNVRIFAFSRRLQQVVERDFRQLRFRTALLIDYRAP